MLRWLSNSILKFFLKLIHILWSQVPLHWLKRLGNIFGEVGYLLAYTRKLVVIKNLEIIGATGDLAGLARAAFVNNLISFFEIFYINRVDDNFLEKVDVIGYKNLKNFIDNGGHFFVSAHIGSWELLGDVVHQLTGVKLCVAARRPSNRMFAYLELLVRNHGSAKTMFSQNFISKIPQLVNQGYSPSFLLDHAVTPRNAILTKFFGQYVHMTAAVPAYVARKNMGLLPAYLIRNGERYTLICEEPIMANSSLPGKERVKDIVDRMTLSFENIIRKNPTQWYLIHRRFKRVYTHDGTLLNSPYIDHNTNLL